MSYTYLQGQEVESSEDIYSAIDACVQSRSKNIPEKSCFKDSLTESCQSSPSGTTSPPLMGDHGKEWWTLFVEDSHVKISPVQEKEQELKVTDQDCGVKWPGSLMKYDPNTRSWKTAQCSLLEGLDVFLGTWPKWGMMRDGECWAQMMPELHTEEKESGFWPTPRSRDYKGQSQRGQRAPMDALPNAVKHHGGTKTQQTWPTPAAGAVTGGPVGLAGGSGNRKKLYSMMGEEMGKKMGCGQLNPPWVEWLMGWPIGWTGLKPLEMDKFQEWQSLHGGY